jgi:hypothetical protein
MPVTTDRQSTNPDEYAADLQDCLHCHGPRSRQVRRLLRLARKERDAEKERIFETKLAEYRRYQRESRQPTLWNLPARGWEWFWDGAQYTPPREVVMTLVYVALALVGVESVKRYVLPRFEAETPVPGPAFMTSKSWDQRDWDELEPTPGRRVSNEALDRVETWLVGEFQEAAASAQLQAALSAQIDSAMHELLASPEFRERLRKQVGAAIVGDPEFSSPLPSAQAMPDSTKTHSSEPPDENVATRLEPSQAKGP